MSQAPETPQVKESQDSVKSEFSELITDIVENNEYILEKVEIRPQELFSSEDVSLHQYVPISSAIKTTDTIDMKELPTEPFQTDDEIKPTYAEIVKRIPESLKSDQDFKKRVNWMKMNLPNITGIYISRDQTCALCLYSWKEFVRRPDQAIFCKEFSEYQNIILDRYDFLRRKDIENDFKNDYINSKKKKKET
jgi:hypothetical protein